MDEVDFTLCLNSSAYFNTFFWKMYKQEITSENLKMNNFQMLQRLLTKKKIISIARAEIYPCGEHPFGVSSPWPK